MGNTVTLRKFFIWNAQWFCDFNYSSLLFQDLKINQYIESIFYMLKWPTSSVTIKRHWSKVIIQFNIHVGFFIKNYITLNRLVSVFKRRRNLVNNFAFRRSTYFMFKHLSNLLYLFLFGKKNNDCSKSILGNYNNLRVTDFYEKPLNLHIHDKLYDFNKHLQVLLNGNCKTRSNNVQLYLLVTTILRNTCDNIASKTYSKVAVRSLLSKYSHTTLFTGSLNHLYSNFTNCLTLNKILVRSIFLFKRKYIKHKIRVSSRRRLFWYFQRRISASKKKIKNTHLRKFVLKNNNSNQICGFLLNYSLSITNINLKLFVNTFSYASYMVRGYLYSLYNFLLLYSMLYKSVLRFKFVVLKRRTRKRNVRCLSGIYNIRYIKIIHSFKKKLQNIVHKKNWILENKVYTSLSIRKYSVLVLKYIRNTYYYFLSRFGIRRRSWWAKHISMKKQSASKPSIKKQYVSKLSIKARNKVFLYASVQCMKYNKYFFYMYGYKKKYLYSLHVKLNTLFLNTQFNKVLVIYCIIKFFSFFIEKRKKRCVINWFRKTYTFRFFKKNRTFFIKFCRYYGYKKIRIVVSLLYKKHNILNLSRKNISKKLLHGFFVNNKCTSYYTLNKHFYYLSNE